MIKNILYVEDGSVDIDALEETLNSETKIIVYRQGSTPPVLVQPEQPISDIFEEAWAKAQRETTSEEWECLQKDLSKYYLKRLQI